VGAIAGVKVKSPTRKPGVMGHPNSYQDLSSGPPAANFRKSRDNDYSVGGIVIRAIICVITLSSSFLGVAFRFPESLHAEIVPDSVKSATFEVRSELGHTRVESRVLQARVELPNDTSSILDVSMLYDSDSKLFWWQADPVPSIHQPKDISQTLPRNSLIFLTGSKFVMFWNGWGSAARILVRESCERHLSMNEGQVEVLRVLEERRGDIQAGKFLHEYKEIPFTGLDRDFIVSKYTAINRGLKLRDVSRVSNNWQIVEDGPNGGSAVIMLNNKYKVLSVNVSAK
jgi:hypothetical protein